MELSLRPALETDFDFCQSLNRSNMAAYNLARNILWDPQRFLASWSQFENFIITADGNSAGLLRLLAVDGALEIRDLQLLPTYQRRGIGTWAVMQAKSQAVSRTISELILRVYPENPAQRLYLRLGFCPVPTVDNVIHMVCVLPPN